MPLFVVGSVRLEFLIESEKENIVGKVYISQETQDLYGQLEKAFSLILGITLSTKSPTLAGQSLMILRRALIILLGLMILFVIGVLLVLFGDRDRS
jgi:hypothetical protein